MSYYRGRRPLSRQAKRWLARRGHPPDDARRKLQLRWQDAVALLALPLAVAGLAVEDTAFVAICFLLSAGVLSISIVTNPNIRLKYQMIVIMAIVVIFGGLGIYVENKNIANGLATNEGTLEPGNKERPTLPCNPPTNAYVFLFGNNVDWTTHRPHAAITIGDQLLSIKITADGKARITNLRIFDDRDDLIARIDDNVLWVNPTSRRERPDSSTLTVFDHLDREVLHIEFLNAKTISLRGVFRYPGTRPIIITDEFANIRGMIMQEGCVGEARGEGFTID